MTLISGMIERAKANKQRIVLPEGVVQIYSEAHITLCLSLYEKI